MDPTDPNYVQELPHHTAAYKADNKGPMIIAVCLAVTVLSTIFVALRVFTRQKIMGQLHLDDWLVIPSIVSETFSPWSLLQFEQQPELLNRSSVGFPMGLYGHGHRRRRAWQREAL